MIDNSAHRFQKLDDSSLAQKIRWEGGLWAALEYGIAPDEIENAELADLWERLQTAFLEFSPLFEEAQGRLKVAA